MKYETPELTALTPAINAIQGGQNPSKTTQNYKDSTTGDINEVDSTYQDWE